MPTDTDRTKDEQESPAGAKVSGARQQCAIIDPMARKYQCNLYTSLKSTFSGLQFCCWQCGSIFIHGSQICENTQNSEKIQTYSSSRSSKVVGLSATRKRICNFL